MKTADIPDEIREQVEQFDKALTDVDQYIKPLLFTNFKETQAQLSPLQRAKLNICLAYTVNTLFYMFLKTQGINTKDHPVKKELARIQEYIKKIKAKQNESSVKRKVVLNKEASHRFIQAVLKQNDNSSSKQHSAAVAENNTANGDDVQMEEAAVAPLPNVEADKRAKKNTERKRKREASAPTTPSLSSATIQQQQKKRKSPK